MKYIIVFGTEATILSAKIFTTEKQALWEIEHLTKAGEKNIKLYMATFEEAKDDTD